MKTRRKSKIEAGFSMASMTDLVFLLLIFMMVATTMISPYALKLNLPKSSNVIKEKVSTAVSIDKDLKFFVEDTPCANLQILEQMLISQLASKPEPTISLNCEKSVPVDYVVQLMNIAKRNNFKLVLATGKEE